MAERSGPDCEVVSVRISRKPCTIVEDVCRRKGIDLIGGINRVKPNSSSRLMCKLSALRLLVAFGSKTRGCEAIDVKQTAEHGMANL